MIHLLFRLLRQRVWRQPAPFLRVAVLLAATLLYGTTGFLYFELSHDPNLGWADGFWWSVVTMATVGYGDLFPRSLGGRFIVGLPVMLIGIALLGYVLSLAASALVQARTRELCGMGNVNMQDQLIIVNFPNLAKVERILTELALDAGFGNHRPVVLIDEDLPELPASLVQRRVHYVRGNPSRDETLQRACIDRARYAVVLSKRPGDLHSDDQALAVTVAIEARAPHVHTVVECVDAGSEELLRKAGCDSIVCTARFDAHFIGHELLNPGVQEVIEDLTSNLQGQQIYLTVYEEAQPTSFANLAERLQGHGHILLGFSREKIRQLNPTAQAEVRPNDLLISMGAQRLTGNWRQKVG